MKKQLWVIFFLLGILTQVLAQEDGDIVKIGDTMPVFSIVSDDGTQVKSSTFKGQVVVLTFFATWCPPCQKELAAIQQTLWPKYKDNPDFKLLVVGREHSDAELAEYNERKGFTFPLYPDKNRAIYSKFAASLIPRVYLVGKDGKVKYTGKGYTEEDFDTLMKSIALHMKGEK